METPGYILGDIGCCTGCACSCFNAGCACFVGPTVGQSRINDPLDAPSPPVINATPML